MPRKTDPLQARTLWKRIINWSVLPCLLLVFGSSSWAQTNEPDFGETCKPKQLCKAGLVCALSGTQGVCVHVCDLLQNKCPHGEKCKAISGGTGACFCVNTSQCPSRTRCDLRTGQCVGAGKLGFVCDPSNPCAWNLYCAKPKGAKESRCLPLCTGLACKDQSPCVSTGDFSVCFCESNAHCPNNGVCINGSCKNKPELGDPCTANSGCSLSHCVIEAGETIGTCFPTCSSNRTCVTGESCIIASGQRVCMCSFQRPCRGGAICRKGVCQGLTPCNSKTPCPTSNHCYFPVSGVDRGICVKTCRSVENCSGEPCMSASSGKRGCLCKENSDCPGSGQECVNYKCRNLCKEANQCKAGLTCKNGSCVSPEPGDTISERVDSEPIGENPSSPEQDAGESEPVPKPEPPCKPACLAPERCNPTTRKCEKLGLSQSCEKNSDCESGLCFGEDFPKPRICSTTDCSKCAGFALKCKAIGGKTACYIKPTLPTPPPKEKPFCGCSTSSGEPPWLLFLIVVVFIFRFRPAYRSSRS